MGRANWKGEELEPTAWGRQGGADTSLHDRHTWHCPETGEVPSKCFHMTGMTYLFPEMPLSLDSAMQWRKEAPEVPPGHSEQGWWISLCSAVVSANSGQQRVQALLLHFVCSSSCSQDYPEGACSDTLCYPTGTEPLCTAQVRTTHQGLLNSSVVNIQHRSACSVKRLKLVQFYTETASPSSTATR